MAPPGMEEMTSQLQGMFQNLSTGKTRTQKLRIVEALKALVEEEAGKLVNEDELKLHAIAEAEENGIVFIDELDKVAKRSETSGTDISREGVQRDLLPLVEGSTVSTKYGTVRTDHVLFIASGRISFCEAIRFDTGTAGPAADSGRTECLECRRLRSNFARTPCLTYRAVCGADDDGGAGFELQRRRYRTYRPDRVGGERADGEHRCTSVAYRDGASVRRHFL